jgi:hypothetical protein
LEQSPLEFAFELFDVRDSLLRIFFQSPSHNGSQVSRQTTEVRLFRKMFHQYLCRRFPVEGNYAGNHLVNQDTCRVDIDFLPVTPSCDFRRHVVHCAHALRICAAATVGNKLGQTHVTDFDDLAIPKNVRRFQIPVYETATVQIRQAFRNSGEPVPDLLHRHAVGILLQCLIQSLARDVFHHHPVIAVPVRFDIKDGDQVGMFEIQALCDSPQFDVHVLLQQF